MKRVSQKKLALLLTGFMVFSQGYCAYAASAIGPGVENLAPNDPLSRYQWGFQNDGALSLNRSDLRKESYQELYQSYKEWFESGQIGVPPRNLEPGDFENTRILAKSGTDMNVAKAFSLYRGSAAETHARRDVVVAVIDTGVDIAHPELVDALWTNADEIPDDGVDNDGNGYVDDVHGYNFYDHSARIRDNKLSDLHGTHAAGTIAAAYGNGGITGITDNAHVKLMILKALGGRGTGSQESVLEAIRYAEENGADICNLSLGTTQEMPELQEAIRNSSMLFVVAAGNGDSRGIGYNTDTNPVYPADYPEEQIISVANLMFDGTLDVSSNYGTESVDIAAPGSYVLSTAPGGGFEFLTGTSMAAPMVTGVCAMVYSYRPDLDLAGVKEAVLATAKPLDALSGKVKSGGIPDLYAAMLYERTAETEAAQPAGDAATQQETAAQNPPETESSSAETEALASGQVNVL